MKPARTWFVGFWLLGTILFVAGHGAWAQSWQAVSKDQSTTASVDWEQRLLKRPTPTTPPTPAISQEPVEKQSTASRQADNNHRIARHSYYDDRGPISGERIPQTSAGRPRARLASNNVMEDIPPGTTRYEPIAEQGAPAGENCEGCAAGADCGDCDPCCGPPCGECCDFGYECFDGRCNWWIRNLTVFAGGHGFKGPVDLGVNGNFGLHEGLGVSGPLGDPWGCGYQMGANFVHSNFSGLPAGVPGTDRTQYFVTAGIFRRELCRGFQWGVVWDYMHDKYYETFNLHQLRGDIGFVLDGCDEIGFLGAFGVGTETYDYGNFQNILLDPTDMYALYFRRNFENGGDGRIWGGATGRGDGLLGADLWVPLGRGFALQNIISYKIPQEGRAGGAAHADESWGLTIQLVWYPGQSAHCQRCNPYRPLMNVADNSLFMVDRIIR